jgi:hypothetical protein
MLFALYEPLLIKDLFDKIAVVNMLGPSDFSGIFEDEY